MTGPAGACVPAASTLPPPASSFPPLAPKGRRPEGVSPSPSGPEHGPGRRHADRRRALHALAHIVGLQLHYRAMDGARRHVHDDVLVAVMGALGVPLDHADGAPEALAAEKSARWRQVVAPVVVHRGGGPARTVVRLPESSAPETAWLIVRAEDGSEVRRRVSEAATSATGAHHDGSTRVRYEVDIGRLVAGYHGLQVEVSGASSSGLVVAAPRRAPLPTRGWGAFLPLYALRRDEQDWGVGSYADLGELRDFVARRGGSFVGTLPLLAPMVDPDQPDASPYLPCSRLAWNDAYVDMATLPELHADDPWAAEARAVVAAGPPAAGGGGHGTGHKRAADLFGAMRAKRPILERLARSVCEAGPGRDQLEAFAREEPNVLDFARFRAAGERAGPRWQDWPGGGPGALPVEPDPDAVRCHVFAQWCAARQLRHRADAGLYLDMPIGVHPAGFDTWRHPGAFVSGVSGGAPPDDFAPQGQVWGFPPLHPEGCRTDGYGYVRAVLRHSMALASMVRVDHVMGLHRLYVVPDGFDPGHGVYLRYPAAELRAVYVLEASRAGTAIVGEDLGTVPREVRTALARDGMLSSFVFQFASTEADPLPDPPPASLASFGTHDLPTFAGYWRATDVDERDAGGTGDAADRDMRAARRGWRVALCAALGITAHDDPAELADIDAVRAALSGVLRHLAASPATGVQMDLEDVWLEPEPQNRPGTPGAGNFVRRSARTLDQLMEDPEVDALMGAVSAARRSAMAHEPGGTT